MVIEIARFQVAPEHHKTFFDTFADVKTHVEQAEGYQSHIISQEIEDPSRISLLVKWRSYEDHVELFEPSEAHEIFINALLPFILGEVEVFHFNTVPTPIGDEK
jgi:heme-degrading monooxygenase HmoA